MNGLGVYKGLKDYGLLVFQRLGVRVKGLRFKG